LNVLTFLGLTDVLSASTRPLTVLVAVEVDVVALEAATEEAVAAAVAVTAAAVAVSLRHDIDCSSG
jgi:hypothetical protein